MVAEVKINNLFNSDLCLFDGSDNYKPAGDSAKLINFNILPVFNIMFNSLFTESKHSILIQTKVLFVFAHVQPPFVQKKKNKINKVLIFEEIPPDSSIPVCLLELFL